MSSAPSLTVLFHGAVVATSRCQSLSTADEETQRLVQSAFADAQEVTRRVRALALFSPNETLEDISTRDLVYIFSPFILAELQGRVKTTEPEQRIERLRIAQVCLQEFSESLSRYSIIPEAEGSMHSARAAAMKDPAKRREVKIQQYKQEKELRARIEVLQKKRRQHSNSDDAQDLFALIASLLPSSSSGAEGPEEDSEVEELARETTLLLLRLAYTHTQAQLETMEQELELLANAPPLPPPGSQRPSDADTWRLDAPTSRPDGPLLDPTGKPLRPFTILPAGAGDRARFQAQVFGPDHRLPTMSIDEYLEIERQRGNILTGGGPASAEKPTTSEQLAMDAEMDGTAFGDTREEEKRRKDEDWARYTDANPRGAGNTMNRG